MEAWDDEDFEPPVVIPTVVIPNKWEGEDEEEEVKDNWEDEEEEKPAVETKDEEAKPKVKKQTLAEKIAEKERRKREEMEKRLREQQEEEDNLTPEERLKRQQESDLKLALETTFGGDAAAATNGTAATGDTIDGLSLPNTKEEFQEFVDALAKKLLPLSKSAEYPTFTENLIRNLCATLSSLDIKKIKTTIDNLYLEKQKVEKGDKAKKNKGKGKAKLKLDDGNPLSAYTSNDFDDYDDFM